MSIAAGIAFIVLGAILTFALKGGHIGDLDLHAVGVTLILAGVIGILLPMLIRNRSRFFGRLSAAGKMSWTTGRGPS